MVHSFPFVCWSVCVCNAPGINGQWQCAVGVIVTVSVYSVYKYVTATCVILTSDNHHVGHWLSCWTMGDMLLCNFLLTLYTTSIIVTRGKDTLIGFSTKYGDSKLLEYLLYGKSCISDHQHPERSHCRNVWTLEICSSVMDICTKWLLLSDNDISNMKTKIAQTNSIHIILH